jgi:hypothetical protein
MTTTPVISRADTALVQPPQPVTVLQGEHTSIEFKVGEAIAGWTLRWRLGKRVPTRPSDEAVLTVTPTITDASEGELTVDLTAAQLALAPGEYIQELRRVDAGSELTLWRGPFVILDSLFVP